MTRIYKSKDSGLSQREIVLEALRKNPGVTLVDLSLLTGLTYRTVQYQRIQLVKEGLVEKKPSRSRHPQAVKSVKRRQHQPRKDSTLEERIEEIVKRNRELQNAPSRDVVREDKRLRFRGRLNTR